MKHDIKAIRLAQSMSQKRLAHEAGIDVRTLRRIESGVDVLPESYRAVCLALRIDPAAPVDHAMQTSLPKTAFSVTTRLDDAVGKVRAFVQTAWGKVIVGSAAIGVAVSAVAAVHAWWYRPNVSVTIAFDRSCDELGIWSKAFKAMDREFPDGYYVKDRIDGAKDCAYNFEAYYDAAGPRDPKMASLVRNLEHVGTKTTVTYISGPQDVTPRSMEYWDKDRRISPSTVESFSRSSYERVYRLNPADLDGDIAYARGLFADQAAFDGYVESLRSSGNLDAIARNGLVVSVLTATPSLLEKGHDDVWTVKFRSKITYSGKTAIDQCLDATMRLKEKDDELGILNIVSVSSVCRTS